MAISDEEKTKILEETDRTLKDIEHKKNEIIRRMRYDIGRASCTSMPIEKIYKTFQAPAEEKIDKLASEALKITINASNRIGEAGYDIFPDELAEKLNMCQLVYETHKVQFDTEVVNPTFSALVESWLYLQEYDIDLTEMRMYFRNLLEKLPNDWRREGIIAKTGLELMIEPGISATYLPTRVMEQLKGNPALTALTAAEVMTDDEIKAHLGQSCNYIDEFDFKPAYSTTLHNLLVADKAYLVKTGRWPLDALDLM